MNFSLNATSMYDKNGKPLCICNKTNCIVECFLLILFFYCLFRGVLWKSDVKFLFLFTFKINRSHRNLIWLLAFDSSSMFTYWVTCFLFFYILKVCYLSSYTSYFSKFLLNLNLDFLQISSIKHKIINMNFYIHVTLINFYYLQLVWVHSVHFVQEKKSFFGVISK